MKRRNEPLPKVTATIVQVTFAKARLDATADQVPGFREAFPGFQAAVDGLPALEPLIRIVQELRPILLDALVEAGARVPREAWVRLGVEVFAPREEAETEKRRAILPAPPAPPEIDHGRHALLCPDCSKEWHR